MRLMKAWVFHALTKDTLMTTQMTKQTAKHMATPSHANHRVWMAGSAAALALLAFGFAGTAHARDNVTFSVGIGVPGVVIGASNAYPVYTQPQVIYTQPQPVYIQPRPVYVQPAPVYYQPAPVYYSAPPVYAAPQPVYYGGKHGYKHGHGYGHGYYRGHDERGERGGRGGYGYAPVYYRR